MSQRSRIYCRLLLLFNPQSLADLILACCLFIKDAEIYLNFIDLLNLEISALGRFWFCFPVFIFRQIFSQVLYNHCRFFLPSNSLKLQNLGKVSRSILVCCFLIGIQFRSLQQVFQSLHKYSRWRWNFSSSPSPLWMTLVTCVSPSSHKLNHTQNCLMGRKSAF